MQQSRKRMQNNIQSIRLFNVLMEKNQNKIASINMKERNRIHYFNVFGILRLLKV